MKSTRFDCEIFQEADVYTASFRENSTDLPRLI